MKDRCFKLSKAWLVAAYMAVLMNPAQAQLVPGAADASRVQDEQTPVLGTYATAPVIPDTVAEPSAIPTAAKTLRFTLAKLDIVGATAFNAAELQPYYKNYLQQDITLETVYKIANSITQLYGKSGFMLARAYVPAQEIAEGVVTIQVVEGYVGAVDLPPELQDRKIIRSYIRHLKDVNPLTTRDIESFLLRVNDLPGVSVSGVLSPLAGSTDGAVKLTLVSVPAKSSGSLGFDNSSSRFLGPNELSLSYTGSFLPLQQTSVAGLTSLPLDKLNYIRLDHSIAFAPDFTLGLTGSVTKAEPGFSLAPLDIYSNSRFAGLSIAYQAIRQRLENLNLKLAFDGRDSETDILNTPFTKDRIRAVRAGVAYDRADGWNGYNSASSSLSQGIDGLGASSRGAPDISRAQAKPDFAKLEVALSRLQSLTEDWSLLLAATGQQASGPLYSAEEFGYGGQGFGRAFDPSEITGDHGAAGSLELRYTGWSVGRAQYAATLSPYAFYDIGVVWNEDIDQPGRQSGASAGFGMRAATAAGVEGNIGLAFPLTRSVDSPIYGASANGPRLLLQIAKIF